MNTKRIYERFILLCLFVFFGGFISSIAIETSVVRPYLSWYAFFLASLYVFRAWYWKEPYDKVGVIGFLLIGLVLRIIHHFA